jgi:WS/DGAT/MGAT family acyltransferase
MSVRFSSADAAWLHMDRPTNLMVINSLWLFGDPVDWERAKRVTQRRLVDRYPRFRERVVESRLPLQGPAWERDPDFALEHHMNHLALPAPGGTAELQDLVSDLMTMPLDRSRPLWHACMVDAFGEGAAMIIRIHHCIADGIALARVMLSLTDSEPDAGIGPQIDPDDLDRRRSVIGKVADTGMGAIIGVARAGGAMVSHGVHIAASPPHSASLAGAIARDTATLLRLLLTPADAATALKSDPGISRRVAWTQPLSLKRIKRTAHANDATVNDVLLAAVSGALRHYLTERGGPVAEINALVPFNLRPLHQPVPRRLHNKFGLVILPLPVQTSGSYRRLVEVHRQMDAIKHSRDAAVSYGILGFIGRAPEPIERRIIDLFSAKGTAVMTNVPPGPAARVLRRHTGSHGAVLGTDLGPHRHEREHLQLPGRGDPRPDGRCGARPTPGADRHRTRARADGAWQAGARVPTRPCSPTRPRRQRKEAA